MNVLGIRFCSVSSEGEAQAKFLTQLGLPRKPFDLPEGASDDFCGAIFPAGTDSWVEIWNEAPGMPAGVMLQVVVDDADAFAHHARAQGLAISEPMDQFGERIYFCQAPGGLNVSFQSKVD